MLFAMGFMKMMVSTRFGLRLLENHPRLFSMGAVSKEGPSLETAKNTNFKITLVGKGWKTKGRIIYDIRKILDPSISLSSTKIFDSGLDTFILWTLSSSADVK